GVGGRAGRASPRQQLARELAGLMLDEPARRGLDEQVSVAIVRSIGVTLQGRLNRPLLEMEWHTLGDIVTRFVADTLTAERTEELASQVYARHFRSEEHTSELQSLTNLVCRLLLEKKNNTTPTRDTTHSQH